MKKELQNLVLKILNFLDIDKEYIKENVDMLVDDEYFLNFVRENRIEGIMYKVLGDLRLLDSIPVKLRDMLIQAYEMNCAHNKDMIVVLKDLCYSLEKSEYHYALLKGAYLIPLKYEPGIRKSNDIDILVSQKSIDYIEKSLIENNFVQKIFNQQKGQLVEATRREKLFVRMNYGELVPFYKKYDLSYIKEACVDINISLDYKAKDSEEIVEKILANREKYSFDGTSELYTLSNVDFILHLCSHLYKEAIIYDWVKEERDSLLYKYCDIYVYLEKKDKDFYDQLLERTKYCGLNKECYYTFYNSMQLFSDLYNNDFLRKFVDRIRPENTEFLKQIYWPMENKLYEYKLDFIDWVFTSNKLAYLQEISNDQNSIK